MTTRTKREAVVFLHSFLLKGIGRALPAGNYEVLTDEELIEGLSFPVYRRVSTMMLAPSPLTSAVEMVTIDPSELRAALDRDVAAAPGPGGNQNPQTSLL
jgi:hypothetical protein